MKTLTIEDQQTRNEALANDLKQFLLDNSLAIDTRIFFNNKCFDWYKGIAYNKEPFILEDTKASDYVEYANNQTVTMVFEGKLYQLLNYSSDRELERKFHEIFSKHNCYFEFGYAWSLRVYFD